MKQLGLYDIVNTPGVAADLSHIATPAKVEGFLQPDDGLKKALTGAELVIIPAGVPRKPGVCTQSLDLCATTDPTPLRCHGQPVVDYFTWNPHSCILPTPAYSDDLFKVCSSLDHI